MREPRPITRVELSEQNKTLRLIAVILLLVIGAVGITVGIMKLLNKESGWQTVQINAQERNCSSDFVLQYYFAGSGAEATAVNSKLQASYGEACVKAYQLFTADEAIVDVQNMYYVNHHPNEEITVDPVLYATFEKLEGTPYLYLGPAYTYYRNLILGAEEGLVQEMDPVDSKEAAAFVGKIAEFAADRTAVNLELLGNNRVKLHVSEEYLAFAAAEELETYLDFGYMTNAFVIDYLAQTLIDQELTQGFLASADGFTRNLTDIEGFNYNIFDREENLIYPAGTMAYEGPISIVYLKDYPTAGSDRNYRENGNRFIHLFADPADGICCTSVENLVSYSYDVGCADVLLQMLPSFVGQDFSVPQGVFSIWCEDRTICYNDETVSIRNLLQDEQVSYQAILKK